MQKVLYIFFLSLLVGRLFAQTAYHEPIIDFKVKDKTPQFLRFYDSATKKGASEEQRWVLWKSLYDFAAVPPTEQGDSIARRLLNSAWPRYAKNLPLIKKGAGAISPGAKKMLAQIAGLLRPDSALDITLLAYVGGFEGNAFNTARNGKVILAVAVETPQPKRSIIMAHELTHSVHIGMGKISGEWIRTIGAIVISEGLALHVSKKNTPQHD